MKRAALVVMLAVAGATGARAQAPSGGSWEISGGAAFVGGFDLESRAAQLTSNTGTTGGTFDQFRTDGEVKPAYGLLARIGVFITPSLSVEGGVRWTRPVHAQRITGDTEGAAAITAEETLNQYVFEGSALWHFGRGRAVPFVFGGGGYLRELHEGDAFVEEGVEVHAGAGLKWWLSGRHLGVRAEGGLSFRDGGFETEDKRRAVPVAAGSLIWVF